MGKTSDPNTAAEELGEARTRCDPRNYKAVRRFVTDWSVGVRRQFRILTIVDCATRAALAVEVDCSMPSSKVALALAGLKRMGRKPAEIRVDNGPAISSLVQAQRREGDPYLSGKPMQNGLSRVSMEGFGTSA